MPRCNHAGCKFGGFLSRGAPWRSGPRTCQVSGVSARGDKQSGVWWGRGEVMQGETSVEGERSAWEREGG